MKNRFEGLEFTEAKKLYRNLAMKCHPDKGGTVEEFQELTREFEEYLKNNSNNNGKVTSGNLEELLKELLSIVPEEYLRFFTESSIYKVFSSGIVSDALGFLGKSNEKVKSWEEIIRKLKQ